MTNHLQLRGDQRAGTPFAMSTMEEPLMSFQTVHPMTPKQAIGLAGANANAVNGGGTSFAVAQYLLTKKHILNDHYNELLRRVAFIVQWERLIKCVFGVDLSLESLVAWPRPSAVHSHFIVSPHPEQLSVETIFFKCCQEFEVKMCGEAWEEEVASMSPNTNLQKRAAKFLAGLYPVTNRYGSDPLGILIEDHMQLPRLNDRPPTPCFRPQELEMGRAIDIREFLIWVLVSRYHASVSDSNSAPWKPPLYKMWCLGSKGYGSGMTFERNGFRHQAKSGTYYPLVYWVGDRMYIDCTVTERGDENTGTRYVVRPPT